MKGARMAKPRFNGAVLSATMCLGISLLVFSVGCARQDSSSAADTQAAEAAIRKTDADWVKAAQTKNPDAWMAFYSDDAIILPPNDPSANTHDSIRKGIAGLMSLPGLSLTWQPTKVEVARSGDLGYLHGTYQMSFSGPGGKTINDTGKLVEIWKKQADGSWKCIVDTWNSDLPPAPAEAK